MRPVPRDSGSSDERILQNVGGWLKRYLEERGQTLSYEHGLLSAALEIESMVRIIEATSGMSLIALNKIEISSVLRTLLRSLKIDDDALEWYALLIEYADCNRPNYIAYASHDVPSSADASSSDTPPPARAVSSPRQGRSGLHGEAQRDNSSRPT